MTVSRLYSHGDWDWFPMSYCYVDKEWQLRRDGKGHNIIYLRCHDIICYARSTNSTIAYSERYGSVLDSFLSVRRKGH
jgi:hypothetical protein